METETISGPVVLDDSGAKRIPTGYVTVTTPEGVTDRDLADAAGFCSRHWGFTVTRYVDGNAVVALHAD